VWRRCCYVLLLGLTMVAADAWGEVDARANDDASVGTSYTYEASWDSGLLTVFLLNVVAMISIMVGYYNMRAENIVQFRDDEESASLLGTSPSVKQDDRGGARHDEPLRFPSHWQNRPNALARFTAFWRAWFGTLRQHRYNDVVRILGFDAAFYLQMQESFILLFVLVCVLSMFVLLPVYLTSGEEDVTGFFSSTAVNIPSGDARLWAPLVIQQVYTVAAYGLLIWLAFRFLGRPARRNPPRTAQIKGLSRHSLDAEALKRHYGAIYDPAQQARFFIVPDNTDMEHKLGEKSYCEEKLAEYQASGRGGTLTLLDRIVNGFPSRSSDAAEYFESRLEKANAAIQELRQRGVQSSGVAFVTFEAQRECVEFCKTLRFGRASHIDLLAAGPQPGLHHEEGLQCVEWKCDNHILSIAPPAGAVNWGSLPFSHSDKVKRRAAIYGGLMLGCMLFFVVPYSILGGLSQLISVITSADFISWVSNLLTTLLASLIMVAIATVVPRILEALSKYSLFNSRSSEERVTMIMIYVFLVLLTFILPSILLTTFSAIATLVNGNSTTQDLSSLIFPNVAPFVSFIMISAFAGNGVDLLMPGDLASRILAKGRDQDDRPHVDLPTFHYGQSCAYFLSILAICLFYCVLAPVMAPFALVFVLFRHLIEKHNMLYRCRIESSEGVVNFRFFRAIFTMILVAIVVSQMGILLYMLSKNAGLGSVLVSLLMMVFSAALYAFVFYVKREDLKNDHVDEDYEEVEGQSDDIHNQYVIKTTE